MFVGDATYKEIVDEVKSEVDIAIEIPDKTYFRWLDSLTTLLYTEIVKEQTVEVIEPVPDSPFITMFDGEDGYKYEIRFEDIIAVYADDIQLTKSTPASGVILPNTFYKYSTNAGFDETESYSYFAYNTEHKPKKLTIVFLNRNFWIGKENSMLRIPTEFTDLAKAKLRGEAYKLANEDALAAKWLNDYNTLLETFKVWIADRTPKFGL